MTLLRLFVAMIATAAFSTSAGQAAAEEGAGMSSSGTEPQTVEPAGGATPRVDRLDPQSGPRGSHTLPSVECQNCQTVQGKVLTVNENTILIRDKSKSEIKLKMTKDTIIGQVNPTYGGFLEGDRIEAYVKPDGELHSISVLRPAGYRPGPDEIGG